MNSICDTDVFWDLGNKIILMVKFDIEEERLIKSDYMATKIFLSINDRGKTLSILERLKALLMFYDFKKLEGRLKKNINETFAAIFANLDYITSKEKVVKSLRFEEPNLLNYYYHYIWKYLVRKYNLNIPYEYDRSVEGIYEDIRKALIALQSDEQYRIENFISDLINIFNEFATSFKEILYQDTNNNLKLITDFLGLSARLYPLIIGLHLQGNLDNEFIRLVEMVDIYVYKAKKTDPRASLYRDVISDIRILVDGYTRENEIKEKLRGFVGENKGSCESRHPQLTKYLFWIFEKEINPNFNVLNLELYEKLDVEHILSETNDNFTAYGFELRNDYDLFIEKIGNLTILEEKLNRGEVKNKNPVDKADIYLGKDDDIGSKLMVTRNLARNIKHKYNGFTKKEIVERTKELLDFVEKKWSIHN
ncbi:MAG: HNH endonuclease family protein [Thermodesulfobacteriota bacterium]